ncbi:MAG TPA: VOC family protein [Acidimicrobiales bacterium]|nr:VOC family protein [Acidimicrobiales bacterium]
MLGHLGLNVPDLGAAKAYYDEVMPLLGYEPFISSEAEFAYLPAGGKPGTYLFFYPALDPVPYSGEVAGLQHLAFIVPTRSAVRAVHQRVTELGGEVLRGPQEFPQYPPPYFATFWLDPFGLKLEAVCHHDRD